MTQIEKKKMTRKERRLAPARISPPESSEIKAEVLRLLRGGSVMTEICAQSHMPDLNTLFRWKRNDPAFEADFQAAIEDHATTLISDAMEGAQAVADADADADVEPVNPSDTDKPNRAGSHAVNRAKSAEFYINSALKYAAAMAPHKYGSLLKTVSAEIGNGVSITVTSYATNPGSLSATSLPDTGSTAPLQIAPSV